MATVAIALFGAGLKTTAQMIGNGLLTLHRHLDEWRHLIADPGLARNATEEILRFESSLVTFSRTALSDTSVGGKPVAAGQRVLCVVRPAITTPRYSKRRGVLISVAAVASIYRSAAAYTSALVPNWHDWRVRAHLRRLPAACREG